MATTEKTTPAGVKHASLAAALAAFQTEVPAVVKGATAKVQTKSGSDYTYQYAGLETITPLVLPLLGKHGLSFSSQPTLMGESFVLHYSLTHESGEAVEGIYPLPDPETGKPQEIGSAITYARRYALCAVTGVAPGGDDDDAQAANDKPAGSRSRAQRKTSTPVPRPVQPSVASQNWAAHVLDVNTIDDLRAVHVQAEQAGELGHELNPEHSKFLDGVVQHFGLPEPGAQVTVGALIQAVKASIQARPVDAPAASNDVAGEVVEDGKPMTEWPTREPGSGGPERDPEV